MHKKLISTTVLIGTAAFLPPLCAEHTQMRITHPTHSAEEQFELIDKAHALGFDGLAQFDWTHFSVKSPLEEGYGKSLTTPQVFETGSTRNNLQVYPEGFSTGFKLRRFQLYFHGSIGCDFHFKVGLGFEPSHDVWHKNEVEIIQSQILDSKPIFLIRQ